MKQYVTIDKRSKKAQKEYYSKQRGTWGELNPVTRGVPRMVKLMEEGYGTDKGIPQVILAGASVDDVYVIVLFTTFTGIMQGKGISVMSFINIPVSIILGILIGLIIGYLFARYFAIPRFISR